MASRRARGRRRSLATLRRARLGVTSSDQAVATRGTSKRGSSQGPTTTQATTPEKVRLPATVTVALPARETRESSYSAQGKHRASGSTACAPQRRVRQRGQRGRAGSEQREQGSLKGASREGPPAGVPRGAHHQLTVVTPSSSSVALQKIDRDRRRTRDTH